MQSTPEEQPNAHRRGTLVFLVILLLILVGMGALGLYYFQQQRGMFMKSAQEELTAIASLKADRITTWMNDRYSDAAFLSSAQIVSQDIGAFLANSGDVSVRRRMQNWLNVMKGGDRYAIAALFDHNLNLLLSVPAFPPGVPILDPAARAHIQSIRKAGRAAVGELRLDPVTGKPFLDITAPVFPPLPEGQTRPEHTPEPVAFVLLRIDPQQFLYPLIQEWPTPSNTAETLLVCRDKDEVLFLNELRHHRNTALKLRQSLSKTPDLPATQAVLGKRGIFEGNDYRSEPVIAALVAVEKTPWLMVSKVDKAELYAPLRSLTVQMGVFVLFLLVMGGVMVGLVWNRQVRLFLNRQLVAERQRQVLASRIMYFNEYANDIIILADAALRIIEANRSACSAYGYNAQTLRTMALPELSAPDSLDDFMRCIHDVRRQGNNLFTCFHRRADGTTFPVEVSICQLELDGARYYQCISRDISERMKAGEELRLRDEKLHAFFEGDLIGTLFGDISGGILRANNEFLRMIGYTQEDLAQGRVDWKTITPPEFVPRDLLHILEAQKNGSCRPYEKQYIRKDGSRIWVLLGFILVGPRREESVAFILDMSELKKAEEELRVNQERLNNAQEIGRIGSWEFNRKTGRIWMSPEGFRLFGLPEDRAYATQQEFEERIDEREEIHQHIADALETGRDFAQEITVRGDGAQELILSFNARVLRESSGTAERLAGVMQDITARKLAQNEITQLNERLSQMNAELEERVRIRTRELEQRCAEIEALNKQTIALAADLRDSNYSLEATAQRLAISNQELEAFSYSVSHDLRAPLRALDGFSEALLEDFGEALNDRGRDYLNRLKSAAQRMGQLIDDLLKLSRITRSEMDLREVDLSLLVRVIGKEMAEMQPDRTVEFVVQPDLKATGDERLLRVALENMIGNAWKFTRNADHPRITFGTLGEQVQPEAQAHEEAARSRIPLDAEEAPHEQVFYLRDNGAGFDMQYAGKLFGAFQRMHNSRQFEGTGIGLATVKRVMQRHGGRVWAEGLVDQGATIYFALPVIEPLVMPSMSPEIGGAEDQQVERA